jgi:hypothetical protein
MPTPLLIGDMQVVCATVDTQRVGLTGDTPPIYCMVVDMDWGVGLYRNVNGNITRLHHVMRYPNPSLHNRNASTTYPRLTHLLYRLAGEYNQLIWDCNRGGSFVATLAGSGLDMCSVGYDCTQRRGYRLRYADTSAWDYNGYLRVRWGGLNNR